MRERVWDCVVVGRGLAGATVASALALRGQSVCVVGEVVSQVPGATLHPFPGRSFRRAAIEFEAFRIASEALKARSCVVSASMRRPLTGKAGARLSSSYDACHTEIPEFITHQHRGDSIDYSPAFGVDVDALIAELLMDIPVESARVEPRVEVAGGVSRVCTVDGVTHCARHIIVAPGASLDQWAPELPVEFFGGQVVEFEPWPLSAFVASSGHIGPMPSGRPVAGASFWPVSEPVDPDDAARAIIQRLQPAIPEVAEKSVQRIWTGYRAVATDRFPIIGRYSDGPWIVGALGARGLYWAFALAEWTVAALLDDRPVPAAVDINRLIGA